MRVVLWRERTDTVVEMKVIDGLIAASTRFQYIGGLYLNDMAPKQVRGLHEHVGLRAGLESLREPASTTTTDHAAPRAQTLMLLTDGRDTSQRPPRGHVEELRSYRDQYPELQVQQPHRASLTP